MTNLSKEQLASQVLALINARFERPTSEEITDILERAKSQLSAAQDKPRTLSLIRELAKEAVKEGYYDREPSSDS